MIPSRIVALDHTYAFPPTQKEMRKKVIFLKQVLAEKEATENILRCRLKRAKESNQWLMEKLREARISYEGLSLVEERFQGLEVELIKNMAIQKKKTAPFPTEIMEFAMTIFYQSPKAYDSLQPILRLPCVSTLRKRISNYKCMPGILVISPLSSLLSPLSLSHSLSLKSERESLPHKWLPKS